MNLNQAIEIIKEYKEKYIDDYYFENNNCGELFLTSQAIEKVLNELENSIPKSKIEEKLEYFKKRCEKKYELGCTYCGNVCPYYARCELCKEFLEEE